MLIIGSKKKEKKKIGLKYWVSVISLFIGSSCINP